MPELIVEAPESLAGLAERVRGFDRTRLFGVVTLTGLRAPSPPILVLLIPEESAIARQTPSWVAGFAETSRDLVVLFPARIDSYPYDSLEEVLHHEVTHILTARAAGGGRVPRWFTEGLASAAERNWSLDHRSRFVWETLAGGRVTVTELEGLFEDEREVARAYILADGLVRDLLERHGPDAGARVLSRMAGGAAFEQALWEVTGTTSTGLVRVFWSRHRAWEGWIAFIGGPFALWSLVTLLALAAIWKSRRRRTERRRRWEAEERTEQQEWEEHRRNDRVH